MENDEETQLTKESPLWNEIVRRRGKPHSETGEKEDEHAKEGNVSEVGL